MNDSDRGRHKLAALKNRTFTFKILSTESYLAPISHKDTYEQMVYELDLEGVKATPVRLFSSVNQLIKNYKINDFCLSLALKTFIPGPLIVSLISRESGEREYVYVPQNQDAIDYIKSTLEPVYTPLDLSNQSKTNLTTTSKAILPKGFRLLETKSKLSGVYPTILNVITDTDWEILRPGMVSKKEIESVIAPNIKLKENYLDQDQQIPNIYHVDKVKPGYLESQAVFVGTREALTSHFGKVKTLGGYFKIKKAGHSLLFNLGSRTNPENIAKHFYANLQDITKLGYTRVVFLKGNYGKSKWAKIIDYA